MKSLLSFCVACVLVATPFSVPVNASPSLSAECAVLYETSGKNILYEKQANKRHGIASTTKIMTALVAIENSDPDELVCIPKEAVGIEGSSLYLTEGETYSMRDLLYALMLRSANDAATAIAIHVAGSVESFASMMNERVQTLGLTGSHFTNPHGLDDDEHYSTAADLAVITSTAMEYPLFQKIVSTKQTTICKDRSVPQALTNHNRLLSMYDGAVGVKTGYTRAIGRCLVSAAVRDGMTLVAVTLNAPNDWSDHTRLLDYGFSAYERKTLAAAGDVRVPVPVSNGKTEEVVATNHSDITAVLPRSCGEIQTSISVNPFLFAPVKRGDVIGHVLYYYKGKRIADAPLVAERTVRSTK